MMQNDTKRLAKDELYRAIVDFVERQQLVVQAMLDMRLDINAIGKFGALGWVSSVSSENGRTPLERFEKEPVDEYEQEIYSILKHSEEIKVPRKGVWKDKSGQTWSYILHGGGCLLENPETKEPINWDCPNSRAFDRFFFLNHLEWRLKQGDYELKHVQELHSDVEIIFSEFLNDGSIRECQMPMGLVYLLDVDEA